MTTVAEETNRGGNLGEPSGAASIERVVAQIGEISTLPDVALRIMAVVDDPASAADDLLEAVRSDPSIAMRLMRTVNSSYYALTEKAADLKQAVTLLGFEEVRNLALTAYVAQLFKTSGGHGRYHRRDLWDHMVATGVVARLIAKTCGKVPPQEAYAAGLLHDVGLILIDQQLHKRFCRVVDALSEKAPICEVERRILGFDHAALGEFVARKWNLPETLAAAIGEHHSVAQYDGPQQQMVFVVALANFLCHLKDITSLGVRNVQMPPTRIFDVLELGRQQISQILGQLDEALCAVNMMAIVQVP